MTDTAIYRHPKMVDKIENAFGKDIKTLLIETTRKHKNMRDQAIALNISVTYLMHLIERYFYDWITFMAIYTKGWRKKKYLRRFVERKSKK